MEMVFEKLVHAKVFLVKGVKVKLSRWMTIWDAWCDFRPYKTCYLLVLTWICLKQNFIKRIDDIIPFLNAIKTDVAATVLPHFVSVLDTTPVPEAAPAKKEVRLPDKDVKQKREKAKNTLHLALVILCDPIKSRIMDGLYLIVRDMRVRFGQAIQSFNDLEKSMEWCINNAAGKDIVVTIRDIVSSLDSGTDRDRIGFLAPDDYTNWRMTHLVGMDQTVSLCLWNAQLNLIAFRLVGFLLQKASLPFYFALLLSQLSAEVDECLSVLKVWYNALDTLEHVARRDRRAQSLLNDITWARNTWVRMILLGLREARFESVPTWVMTKIRNRVECFVSTVGVEYFNRAMRSAEKKMNDNHNISRQSRYYSVVTSPVLGDINRCPTQVTPQAARETTDRMPPPSTYDPEEYDFSLGEKTMKPMSDGKLHWMSPQNSNLVPITWMAWLAVSCDIDRYAKLFLSLLAVVGSIIRHKTTKQGGLVVKVVHSGVIVLSL